MNIVFRVDGSIQMGTGHVMRCLTLAEELQRLGHSCVFICREHPGNLGEFITNKGFVVHLLSTTSGVNFTVENDDTAHAEWLGVSWRIDAEQTLAALGSMEVDWLVVDHYALDARWERLLAKAAGQIMVIDDLADRHHACDLLLDQNLGREITDYDHKVPEHCTRLVGPNYALLRPEFARLREKSLKRRKMPELKRILISLGGVDRTNVTAQVLNVLNDSQLSSETELDVIMGATAPHLNDIRTQVSHTRFRATVSVNVGDMAERMCRADLAVGAAGSTSWERCCLGLPALIVVLADNQKSAAHALSERGVAIVASSLT
ncbi:UDP-2,4-diacetamido-2,4,6-trideoxy-beta-L-altropyranose hydrolase [Marinobacter sp. ELB17]|uniref:UDP-2,4-diacetamido-2,4, 6-trideoxy-beta-L-altropyranose hydrolase n=1 Tax=Marinobacter sp. ELB17 TaxID=270374 RepID=UPI0000F3A861|nr:UDP-2,4-diacetamido-2,4,6-trideoxy-beta-L-altropyranose hydrolase [Marinobacter sp. ELB17]EAZ98227.1 probable polysaccharide biosynthesis protein [Marinobacter sp. ELB17]